ncbi:MAG: NADH-quinone oxidoreductase subunit C, partial [Chthoniobacterales bacterium]
MNGAEVLSSLAEMLGARLLGKTEFRGETTFTVAAADLRDVALFCRDELCFDYLLDITSVDN